METIYEIQKTRQANMNLFSHWLKGKVDQRDKVSHVTSTRRLFIEATNLVRESRKERFISRRELASKTKITTPVLEAIENGWVNSLPEPAYLCTMLSILENELNIPKGNLDAILKFQSKYLDKQKDNQKSSTNNQIDLLKTWQGNFIYLILMLSSIWGINHQQRYIASLNSQTFHPIPLNLDLISNESSNNTKPSNKDIKDKTLLKRYKLVEQVINKFQNKRLSYWLDINLSQPSEISIINGDKRKSDLNRIQGSLRIKLLPPAKVSIIPPPESDDKLIWKGQEYIKLLKNGEIELN